MSVYSVGYPIYHKFKGTNGAGELYKEITYEIGESINGVFTPFFNGRLVPYEDDVTIDISNVMRDRVNSNYEPLLDANDETASVPYDSINDTWTIRRFIVRSVWNTGIGDAAYDAIYSCNTNFRQPLLDWGFLNDPIDVYVDPRQLLIQTAYNRTGEISYRGMIDNTILGTSSLTSNVVQYNAFDLNSREYINVGGKVTSTTIIGNNTLSYEFNVVEPCDNRFVLYYVNKLGGLDHMVCVGKDVESWTGVRTDVRLYDDRLNMRDWQQKRIWSDIDHLYEMNTGLLPSENARKIDHLIHSPKAFIHDLKTGEIESCLIDTNSISTKTWRYDKLVQFTFHVKTSQKQIRF